MTDALQQINQCFLGKSLLQIFQKLFPWIWFESIFVVQTSAALEASKCAPTNVGEMLCYLGIWLLMATVSGYRRDDFWGPDLPHDMKANHVPYNFGIYMSAKHFKTITANLQFTNTQPPACRDPIWQVQLLLKAWDDNMAAQFLASWVLCLD